MSNGRIIGAANPSTISSASGIWDLNDVRLQRSVLSWPRPPGILTHRANTTGSGTTTALTLTHPAAVQTGDLCILFHYSFDNDDDITITAPSGFNVLFARSFEYTSTTFLSTVVSYRVLTATTSVTLPLAVTSTDSTATAPDNQSYTAVYFYLDRPIETVTIKQISHAQATGDPAARTLDTNTHTNTPILVLGSVNINSGTPAFNASTTTFNATIKNTGGTNIETIIGYTIYNTVTGSSYTVDCNDISNQQLLALSIAVQ